MDAVEEVPKGATQLPCRLDQITSAMLIGQHGGQFANPTTHLRQVGADSGDGAPYAIVALLGYGSELDNLNDQFRFNSLNQVS